MQTTLVKSVVNRENSHQIFGNFDDNFKFKEKINTSVYIIPFVKSDINVTEKVKNFINQQRR